MSNEIEQYLIDEHNVLQHDYLESSADIKEFFNDYTEIFECGQGYFEEEKTTIIRTKDGKFYETKIVAEITSAKQDRGERLYWVESIESVEFREVDKPEPKPRKKFMICASLTVEGYDAITRAMIRMDSEYSITEVRSAQHEIMFDGLRKKQS